MRRHVPPEALNLLEALLFYLILAAGLAVISVGIAKLVYHLWNVLP